MPDPSPQAGLTNDLTIESPDILKSILETWPSSKWAHTKTVVGVSGGPDSVAMLRILNDLFCRNRCSKSLIVAHFNHQIQTNASEVAQFVKELANSLELEFETAELEPVANPSEELLRESRHDFLTKVAQRHGARYVAFGHNQDDQVETILFRIFRGTGLAGLQGISRFRDIGNGITFVRPLLDVSRNEILSYLTEQQQDYRVDPSNSDSRFTRNFLRNELIPKIQERFGTQLTSSILKLGEQAKIQLGTLDQLCNSFEGAVEITKDGFEIDCRKFRNCPTALVTHFLKTVWAQQNLPLQAMTFQHWIDLTKFATQIQKGVKDFPGAITVKKLNNSMWLRFPRNPAKESED